MSIKASAGVGTIALLFSIPACAISSVNIDTAMAINFGAFNPLSASSTNTIGQFSVHCIESKNDER